MPDRERAVKAAADALRRLAPGHECRRIWGRAAAGPAPGAVHFVHDPDDQGPAGSVWAGDPEGVARVVLEAADRADTHSGIHRVNLGSPAGAVRDIISAARTLFTGPTRTTDEEPVQAHDEWCQDVRHVARLSEALLARPNHDPNEGAVDEALRLIARVDDADMQLRRVGREMATAVADREAAEERLLAAEGLAVRAGEDELVPRAPDETGQAVRDRRGGLRFTNPAEQLGMIADCLNRHALWDDDCSTGAAAVRLIEQGRSAKLTLDNLTVELRTGYGLDERDISRAFRRIDRGDADRQTLHVIVDWLLRNYPSPEADRAATALTEPAVDKTPVAKSIIDAIRKAATGLWMTTERQYTSTLETEVNLLQLAVLDWKQSGQTIAELVFSQATTDALEYESYPPDQERAWSHLTDVVKGIRDVMRALTDANLLIRRLQADPTDDPLPEPEQAADDEDERAGLWMTTERNG